MLKYFLLLISAPCWAAPNSLTVGYFSERGSETGVVSRLEDGSVVLEFPRPVTVIIENERYRIERVRAFDVRTGVMLGELALRATAEVVLKPIQFSVPNMLAHEYYEIVGERRPRHLFTREVTREYPMTIKEIFLSNLKVGAPGELTTEGEPWIQLKAVLNEDVGNDFPKEDISYLMMKGEIWKLPHLSLQDDRVQSLIKERRAEISIMKHYSGEDKMGFRGGGEMPMSPSCVGGVAFQGKPD